MAVGGLGRLRSRSFGKASTGLQHMRHSGVYVWECLFGAGQTYVYNPARRLIDKIDVPERPTRLVLAGKIAALSLS